MVQVQQLSERREVIDAATAALGGIGAVLWQAGGGTLGPLFRQLDDLSRVVEAARVAVLSEAIGRGETTSTLARAHAGWIIEWAPSLRAGGAGALLAVTLAARQERHALLREALLSGRVPVRNAAVCLAEMERIRHRLTPEAVPSVWEGLLTLAAADGPRAIRALRPALLAAFGCPGELDGDQERVKAKVSLSQAMGGGDGLFDYALRLDTEGKAVLEAALGPLSAPRPGEGVADLRPASQRRAEALVELVRRAVSAPEGAPTATKATLFVTVSWEDLVGQLRAGAVIGSSDGGTLSAPGTLLAPGTVRRMACDAGIIPVVLGTDGQVLDLGREWRWFTPGQTKVLWLRDGACTIPGCAMPAQWCDAHHLWHFADGGPTDLAYAALLCGYHHHWVHLHRLAGRVVDGQVRWDLAAGSYDSYLREIATDDTDDPVAIDDIDDIDDTGDTGDTDDTDDTDPPPRP